MNEFAFEYEFLIRREGGLEHARVFEIIKEINRTPVSPLKYKFPIETLKNLLQDLYR